MIKFIHCADLHLDAPFQLKGHVPEAIMADIFRASFESFSKLIKDAVMQQVDFVLIAGDVLASDNQTLKTTLYLKKQFQRLKDAGIYVYIILGEADAALRTVRWPDNVIIFGEQVESYQFITKEGDRDYIHGVSHGQDTSYFPTNQVDTSIHIGMLQGALGSDFSQEELNQRLYHYWALGGSHKRQLVSELPHIHYPGNIQSSLPEETGRKGYLMVEGNHVELNVVFVPTAHITFETAVIPVSVQDEHALLKVVQTFMDEKRDGKSICRLTFLNEHETLISPVTLNTVLSLSQQHETHEHQFVWLDELTVRQQDMTTLHREFDAAMLNDRTLFERAMQPLYHDAEMNRFLDDYDSLDGSMLIQSGEIKLKARLSDEN